MRYEEEHLMFLDSLVRAIGNLALRSEDSGDVAEKDAKALADASDSLRLDALTLLCEGERDVASDCAARMQEIASEHGVSFAASFADRAVPDGDAVSWRELQLAQEELSRACDKSHASIGPSEQMCRHARRLAVIAGYVTGKLDIEPCEDPWRPYVDLLLLTVRFMSAAGKQLPELLIPRNARDLDQAMAEESNRFWF